LRQWQKDNAGGREALGSDIVMRPQLHAPWTISALDEAMLITLLRGGMVL